MEESRIFAEDIQDSLSRLVERSASSAQSRRGRRAPVVGLGYAIMVQMEQRPGLYPEILADHLRRHRQMAFVSGPRQVGKTTTCRSISDAYLNWDNADDRRRVLRGPASLAAALQLDRLRATIPVAVLDELHKYSKWKGLLKGFFDTYGDRVHLIVTGSSRLDVFRRGGDSLMGRYLLYRMHPWSVGESLRTELRSEEHTSELQSRL